MKNFIKIMIIIIIGWGLYFDIALIFSFDKKYPEEVDLVVNGKVISEKTEKDKSNSYVIKINKADISNIRNTKIILYTDKKVELNYGDIIEISGKFSKAEKARNYKGFNYRNYLKQSKIYGSIYCKNVKKVGLQKGIIEKIYKLKLKFNNVLDNIYNEQSSAFLKGLLLGNSNYIDDDIKENFKNSSMSHILAISGMHVSYVIVGMQFVLNKLINKQKLKNFILIILLVFFAIITGGANSCVRACIMNGILLISQNLYRKNNFFVSIFIIFIILIFMNPYNIFSVGMWLSFGGTLGIVLFHNFLKRFVICKLKIKSKSLKIFLDIFLVSFSTQIMIFPIMLYCFNTLSLTFFVSNLLIYFLIGPILAIGYISMFTAIFIPSVGKIFAIFENFLIVIIYKIADFCSEIPFSKVLVSTPDFWIIILYYLLMFCIIYIFCLKKFKCLKYILGNNISKFVKTYLKQINIICVSFIIICSCINIIPRKMKIYFVDVGQGDCTVIKSEKNKNIIIDGGNNQDYDYGKNVVVPYLLDRKINHIYFLMISHFDSDHCGGLLAVLENIKVDTIIIGKQLEEYENCSKIIKLAKKKKINIKIVQAGDKVKIDKNTKFDILWPDNKNMIIDNSINNNSLVAKLCYKDISVLFTGDIEEIAEKSIIEKYKNIKVLNSNILKVAHHGSKSSSIEEIVEKISPKIGIICVGEKNKYGHPSFDVIERIERNSGKIYRTDENGEISIETNGKKLQINTMFQEND